MSFVSPIYLVIIITEPTGSNHSFVKDKSICNFVRQILTKKSKKYLQKNQTNADTHYLSFSYKVNQSGYLMDAVSKNKGGEEGWQNVYQLRSTY